MGVRTGSGGLSVAQPAAEDASVSARSPTVNRAPWAALPRQAVHRQHRWTNLARQRTMTAMVPLAELDGALGGTELEAALRAIPRLRQLVEQLEADRVAAARAEGWSWSQVATCLGVSKQSVHRKHAQRR